LNLLAIKLGVGFGCEPLAWACVGFSRLFLTVDLAAVVGSDKQNTNNSTERTAALMTHASVTDISNRSG